jgi:hypothetical protein
MIPQVRATTQRHNELFNRNRSWNSPPKCALSLGECNRAKASCCIPHALGYTFLQCPVRIFGLIRPDPDVECQFVEFLSMYYWESAAKIRTRPSNPTATLLDDRDDSDDSGDTNARGDNSHEQVHKCAFGPKFRSDASKVPSTTSSTAIKTRLTQFPISEKTS